MDATINDVLLAPCDCAAMDDWSEVSTAVEE